MLGVEYPSDTRIQQTWPFSDYLRHPSKVSFERHRSRPFQRSPLARAYWGRVKHVIIPTLKADHTGYVSFRGAWVVLGEPGTQRRIRGRLFHFVSFVSHCDVRDMLTYIISSTLSRALIWRGILLLHWNCAGRGPLLVVYCFYLLVLEDYLTLKLFFFLPVS